MKLDISKRLDLVNPVMIAGWPGMGSVALGVADYLRRKLSTAICAEVKFDKLAAIDSVAVKGGVASLPRAPRNVFYYTTNPDIIIFEGQTHSSGREGVELLNSILDAAEIFKVRRIYTAAALPAPSSYKDEPELCFAVNRQSLKPAFSGLGLLQLEDDNISGLNGLLLGFAQKRNIEAASFLATIPHYAMALPNPKATLAVIKTLSRVINFKIDLKEITAYARDMEERMSVIEERVRDVLVIEKDGMELFSKDMLHGQIGVPASVKEKIEKLFAEAKSDKAKAITLKEELDRWDLYKTYEDRFLDLFKRT